MVKLNNYDENQLQTMKTIKKLYEEIVTNTSKIFQKSLTLTIFKRYFKLCSHCHFELVKSSNNSFNI